MSKLLSDLTENDLKALIISAMTDHEMAKKLKTKAFLKKTVNGVSLATLMSMSPIGATDEQDVFPSRINTLNALMLAQSTVNIPKVTTHVTESKKIEHTKTPIILESTSTEVSGAVHFPSGQTKLSPALIDRLNSIIVQLPKKASVIVVGHADSVGTHDSNVLISRARAHSVAVYLHSKGVKVTHTAGRGDNHLIENVKGSNWKNRRVDLVIQSASKVRLNVPILRSVSKASNHTSKPFKVSSKYHKKSVHKSLFSKTYKKRLKGTKSLFKAKSPNAFKLDHSKLVSEHKERRHGMDIEHLNIKNSTELTKVGEDDSRTLFWDGQGKLIVVDKTILTKSK